MSTLGAIIGWIVFGFIIGLIGRALTPGPQPMGWVATIVLGIVGSFIGGLISWIFTGGPNNPYHPAGWILSIIGAIIAVWIYAGARRPRGTV
jgi:uncharacterized membrane protein YeaQ/YmgE (transglycosylase-associated protein family)